MAPGRHGKPCRMRALLRFLLLRRLLERKRRYRRTWGYGYRRPSYGWGYGRPPRRSQVRVTGCCLPIPLGLVLAGAGAFRLRRR